MKKVLGYGIKRKDETIEEAIYAHRTMGFYKTLAQAKDDIERGIAYEYILKTDKVKVFKLIVEME